NVDARPPQAAPFTPGAANSVADVLAAFPPLWLNEVEASNVSGIADHTGARGPWVELYNAGDSAVSLAGYYLSANYTGLAQWAFPAGAVIAPGQFAVVWLDGQPANTTATEWHANFRLAPGAGVVALARDQNGTVAVVDYINYIDAGTDRSYGSTPDGQARTHAVFGPPTPGASNGSVTGSARVLINEWLASNHHVNTDPADGHYDDWFELYNAGNASANLGGYSLTDSLTNKPQFVIPAGVIIPAGGQLLVWADNDTNQNGPNSRDLHVNFKLSADGEEIGLFAPNGDLVDSIRFGAQTNDVSEGRRTDGADGPFVSFTTPTPGESNEGGPANGGGLRITTIHASATGIAITWNSTTGARYQLQTKQSLADATWTSIGDVIVATGPASSASDAGAAGQGQRFYRLVQLGP
ncbi:MAG TPA: lamin tail domain-containing protein, partial [Verrucomicrobiae bacterium]|nr:lamin tail domain-containing protein [Verrucomicrobiae bacterium]